VIISRTLDTLMCTPAVDIFVEWRDEWGAFHTFAESMRKCYEEAHHQINPSKLQLFGFGADARKLYFQFTFGGRNRRSDLARDQTCAP